jgi:exonuclease VII large subunit
MSNLQTGTIRVSKEVLDSIKIYCRKHNKNMGEFVESAWKFIEKNELDIYDEEATPCFPVQQEQLQGKESALYAAMTEFVNAQRQLQLQLPNNNREEEVRRMEELIKWYQGKIDEKDEELMLIRETINLRTNKLEKAKAELRRLNKGFFNKPDEGILKELGVNDI